MVKSIFFLIAISVAADLCAKEERVPSVYDEAKGKWIGDVSALVEKLGNSANGDVIYLGKGEYDLTGVLMENDETKFGKSHLRIQPGVKLLAEDEDRNGTLLVGNGTARILRAVPPDYKTTYVPATIRGLTITNGFAKTFSGAAESKHGGGIYGDATLTNCVVAKCTAEGNGGALCGYIKVHKCLVSNNTASSSGGGTYKATEIKNSEIIGNSSANNGGGICAFTGKEQIFDSVVSGNYAAKNGGGISSYLVVSNCFVSLNTAENSGGGIDNPVHSQVKYVYDSDVCSNKAVTASCGVVSYYTVYRGSIFANYAQEYAGAYNCMLHQVTVHNNYSCTYGGGVVSSSAFGCIERDKTI